MDEFKAQWSADEGSKERTCAVSQVCSWTGGLPMESPRIALSQVSRQRPQLGRGWRNQIRGRSLDAVETGYGRVPGKAKVLLSEG